MSTFLENVKARAKADKKTIVLPESMDRRTFEAAAVVLKEEIANLVIIGSPEEVEANSQGLDISGAVIIDPKTSEKTALYVACVARTYRTAIDDYLESPDKYMARLEWYKEEIGKCTTRNFTTGFYFGKPDSDGQIYDNNTYIQNAVLTLT